MKTTLLFSLIFIVGFIYPQQSTFLNNTPTEVVKIDPRGAKLEYMPGVILVKLIDDASVGLAKKNGNSVTGINSVDIILEKYKVSSAERLFPNAERLVKKEILKSYNGKTFVRPSLHNIYKLKVSNDQELFNAIEELKQDPNVIYAEPDYILSIVNSEPVSPQLNQNEMLEWLKENPIKAPGVPKDKSIQSPLSISPNDPFYSQQWGISATQIDAVWINSTGDSTQIIAILDSGVDWTHPDLSANIWINPSPNIVPDANGIVNDIRGWDFINNDNDPTDDNSHGTHVAGIAAAVGNNGIGISGVNWNAKIMPIKVFQSSGKGDAATITKGIIYAATHGATVINMSFGSYAESYTMEDALENAYSTCALVAAAGNDGVCIGPGVSCAPFYPAALSYVLGIQASGPGGNIEGFSNYDQDGPVYSAYTNLWNYEMRGPGSSIISTIPGGNYRVYSGTSMAAPLLSGAISLYRHFYPAQSQELMWGNLINSSTGAFKLSDAINVAPKPILNFVNTTLVDTIAGDNKNGLADAGETIQLWYNVRNTWGQTDSVFVGIRFGEFEDTTTAQILTNQALIGSISSYATRSNELSPLKIRISPNVANKRDIVFEGLLWYKGSPDTVKQRIVFTINNGMYLSGVMDTTLVLTPNYLWIVNQSFRVGANGTLIIQAGTTVELNNMIVNRGQMFSNGTADSNVILTGGGFSDGGKFTFLYTQFIGTNYGFGQGSTFYNFDHCIFDNINVLSMTWISCLFLGNNYSFSNCIIRNCTFSSFTYLYSPYFYKCNVENCTNYVGGMQSYNSFFPGNYNNFNRLFTYAGVGQPTSILFPTANTTSVGNNFLGLGHDSYAIWPQGGADIINLQNQYWGTTTISKIKNKVYDFWANPSLPLVNYTPYLTVPSDSAHGIVWKILVNGKDAQDEHVDPVGVGPQRFDVYFNREMNPSYSPQLSFGVRDPFTQQIVADSARWSSDHKIWTAYKTLQICTGDGINQLRVSGARDMENFEIPIENMRFQFLIDAAGSSSTGFLATAGLGKVALNWEAPDGVSDLLGYNLYRFNNITDSTVNAPAILNKSLLTDTVYTDFSVIPNKKYYYYYKVVRTDFSESDSSKIVNSVPFTAALGDANGDLLVSVLDILTDVSYILGQSPQPFIFDAADVVRDSSINVLDVVGTVNIVLHGSLKKYLAKGTNGNAKLVLSGDTLKLVTDVPLAGIQIRLKGLGMNTIQFINQGMAGFELATGNKGDTLKTILYYNMNNNELLPGSYVLGTLQGVKSSVSLSEAVLADKNGNNVLTNVIDNGVSLIPTNYYMDQNFPNPFNMETIIQYGVPQKSIARIAIYNILGQRVRTFELGQVNPGRYRIRWDGKNNYGSIVSTGVYIYRFESQKFTSAKKLILLK